jgi:hypothetical protein
MWTLIVPVEASTGNSFRRVRPKAGICMSRIRFLTRFLGAPSIAELRRRIPGDRRAMAEPGANKIADRQLSTSSNTGQLPYFGSIFSCTRRLLEGKHHDPMCETVDRRRWQLAF